MKRIITISLILVVLISACSPRLITPQLSVPHRFSNATIDVGNDSISKEWWLMFGDTLLTSLICRGLQNNRDLAIAASKVEQAQLELGVTRAQYLPSLSLAISAEGERTVNRQRVQDYSIEPSLSWEISIFGAMRYAQGAARAQLLQSHWSRNSVELSLAAQIATTYFTILQYSASLDIAVRTLQLRQSSVALIDSMFQYGMSDGLSLEQARSLVYSTQADIPQYQRAITESMMSLRRLLGESETTEVDSLILSRHMVLHAPTIPTGLPSDLLHRRPDIMESLAAMEQAANRVGLARAARFPTISLTASGGIAGYSIKTLTSKEPWVWSVAGEIIEPIFAFKRLKRQELIAVESYRQSVFDYENSIIAALGEVESALSATSTLLSEREEYRRYVESNSRIEQLTEALFESGMEDYLSVIDARRTLYASQLEFATLTAEYNIACVNLIKALGGGF